MPDLVAAMRSNYEAGRPPHPAERRAVAVYMAVSIFEDGELLRRLALRRPDRIGTHLARIELRPRLGICLADTGSKGHWSIWASRVTSPSASSTLSRPTGRFHERR